MTASPVASSCQQDLQSISQPQIVLQAVVMRHEFKQLIRSGQEVLDLYDAHLRHS